MLCSNFWKLTEYALSCPADFTVDEIERVTGELIPVDDYAKHDKPRESWIIPRGCNKG